MQKYRIGIDPGKKTGFSVTERGRLIKVETLDFWSAYNAVCSYEAQDVVVTIEDATALPVFHNASNKSAQGATGRRVGQVDAHTTLMVDGLRRRGYKVESMRPAGKKTTVMFSRLTGWKERTSQHARDAAMLIIGR